MNHPIPIYLPADLFQELATSTGEGWFGDATAAALCNAVRSWLDRADAITSAKPATQQGYQWQQVFLPDGTELRTTYLGQTAYAQVDGDAIINSGGSLSPSQLANLHGGSRNAWRVIWLRFPGSPEWRRAAHCRALRLAQQAPCAH
jgi:hypothetical protein